MFRFVFKERGVQQRRWEVHREKEIEEIKNGKRKLKVILEVIRMIFNWETK